MSSFFEAKGQDETIWERYKIEKSREDETIWERYKIEKSKEDEIIWEKYKVENLEKESIKLDDGRKLPTWRYRPSHQWYFDAQRRGGSSQNMHLLGGEIDWMGGDWWYLTGQGLSAYGGGAGGYSEGHWGVGIVSPSWKNWQLYGEMLIGAGGGGGVDSGSALLYKPSVGLEYNINKDFTLQTGIGKVLSKEGNLDANTLDVSMVWRFGTPN